MLVKNKSEKEWKKSNTDLRSKKHLDAKIHEFFRAVSFKKDELDEEEVNDMLERIMTAKPDNHIAS